MNSWPKISIITPSFNQGPFLEETIRSVFQQNYPNLEYLIIDGGSRDDSVEIIKKHASRLAYWVSEPDRGQAHAINKGLQRATGDMVAYLNSDDLYLPGAFNAVVNEFSRDAHCRWLAGGWLMFGSEPGWESSCWQPLPPANAAACLYLDYRAAQPGHFWRRQLFEKHGLFDEQYRYAFDHEFYVRLLLASERCRPVSTPLAAYRLHPQSKTVLENQSFNAEWDAVRERYLFQVPPGEVRRARHVFELKQSRTQCAQALELHRRGETKAAWQRFWATVLHWPSSATTRFGWGCLRRLMFSRR